MKSDLIARSVNTNPVVIRRLLGQLNHARLVVSQTGASGGTRLARCPNEINLSEVYKAVSCGEVFALPANAPNRDCPIGRNIEAVLCCIQKDIDKTIVRKLSEYTLADIMSMIEQGQV